MGVAAPHASAFWRRALPAMYAVIIFLDPWIRWWWRSIGLGLGNIVDLRVAGRRSGRPRRVLLTLLKDDGAWFLGHPNGDVAWTRNLEAAGTADMVVRPGVAITVRVRRLDRDEPLRERAIQATGQHPFPADLVYRLARRHIRAVGVFFVVERVSS